MKKNLKRIAGAVVAVSIVLSMGSTAVLARTADYSSSACKITIEDSVAGHTYKAYQIFAGTVSETADGRGQLANITWGSGVDAEAATAALGDAKTVAAGLNAADEGVAKAFAEAIRPYLSSTYTTLDSTSYSADVEGGYYLIDDDEAALSTVDTGLSASAYILEVLGDVTAETKRDVPSVQKKVKDVNDTDGTVSGWIDAADYDIGDDVPFQLTATLPSDYSAYSKYTVNFHDSLSAGLTFKDITSVKIGGADYSVGDVVVKTDDASGEIQFIISDLVALTNSAALANETVVIEYTATLDSDAVLGQAGNPNDVYLEYSNNPNYDISKDSDRTDTDNDGKDDSTGDDSGKDDNGEKDTTGHTPTDEVVVYTYKIVINKKDQDGEALAGAEFKLSKLVGTEYVEVENKLTVDQTGTEFTFTGIDDGTYKIEETTVPNGYNAISPIIFKVKATHTSEQTAGTYDETDVNDAPVLISLTGDVESGTARFATENDFSGLTSDVINTQGVVLPSTGGMGTKVLYGAGGAMVLIAGVLLVTKKRMGEE